MSSAAQEPVTGKQAALLPSPQPTDSRPWPYFEVSPSIRQSVIAGQKVHTLTLGPVAKSVVAPQTPKSVPVPPNAKRVAGQLSANSAHTPVPASARPAAPLSSPPTPAPAPPSMPLVFSPGIAQPIRIADPIPASGGPVHPGTSQSASGAPIHAVPSALSGSGSGRRTAHPVAKAAKGRAQLAPQQSIRRTSGINIERLSTAALVLGLLSVIAAFFTSIPAIVCGHLALRQADAVWTPRAIRRRAQWALGLGYMATIAWLVVVLLSVTH